MRQLVRVVSLPKESTHDPQAASVHQRVQAPSRPRNRSRQVCRASGARASASSQHDHQMAQTPSAVRRARLFRQRPDLQGRSPHRRVRAHGRAVNDGKLYAKKGLVAARSLPPTSARRWRQEVSAAIDREVSTLSIAARCRVLEWPRASYYRAPHETVEADMSLRSLIQQVALAWPCYGYRRITAELNRRGQRVNRKRVLRLMREDNLLVLRKRRFVHTTNSDHRLPIYPNLVPELVITGCDQLWVADITYIRLGREFIYLAVILDAFSRRCIGWALERYLEAELALSALRMALEARTVTAELVDHSDRGV